MSRTPTLKELADAWQNVVDESVGKPTILMSRDLVTSLVATMREAGNAHERLVEALQGMLECHDEYRHSCEKAAQARAVLADLEK